MTTTPAPAADRARALELALLERAGSDSQRQRYAAGLLPEDELLTLARAEMFVAFDGLRRWSGTHSRDAMARRIRCWHNVQLVASEISGPAPKMYAREWDNLQKVTRAASLTNQTDAVTSCDVGLRTHKMKCSTCTAEVTRMSAKVTIWWAGRALVREYAL